MGEVVVAKGRVRPIHAGHPWVFQQAISRVRGAPAAGDPVRVVDPEGRFLGSGFYSPKSAIAVRIATQDPDERLDGAFLARRFDAAARLRREHGLPGDADSGYRLINAEGDRLPGLLVDVYGDTAAVLFGTIGMWRLSEEIFGHVSRVTGASRVIALESQLSAREGFDQARATVRGSDDAGAGLRFTERGFAFDLPETVTQKTGYYFDQRENRARVEALSKGKRVLDAFAFVGSFGHAAARGGAERVLSVDSSGVATAAGARLAHEFGHQDRHDFLARDVKKALPELHAAGERFDLVVVDPPKLVPSGRHLDRGRSAYRAINENALRLVAPGGILVSCSCSAAMRSEDLLRTVGVAARSVRREVTLVHLGQQGPDHPVPAAFSEGRYLDAAFLRVT